MIGPVLDQVIRRYGTATVARRGAQAAYTGWALTIVFGCTGWWNGYVTGAMCAFALAAHLAGGRAQYLIARDMRGAYGRRA